MKIKTIKNNLTGEFYNVVDIETKVTKISKEKFSLIDAVQKYCIDNHIALTDEQKYIIKSIQQLMPAGSGKSFLIELLYNVDKQQQPKWHLPLPFFASHSALPYVEAKEKEKESLLESLQQIMSDKTGNEIKLVGVDEAIDDITDLQKHSKQKLLEQVEFLGFQEQDGMMCDYCEGFIPFVSNHKFDSHGRYWHIKCYDEHKKEKYK